VGYFFFNDTTTTEIYTALDEEDIPIPKTWKKNHGFESWTDAAQSGKELAKKAIAHHLSVAETAQP
jgi:hypothetical protein